MIYYLEAHRFQEYQVVQQDLFLHAVLKFKAYTIDKTSI